MLLMIRKILKQLGEEEKGQILYMTIVMMMLLVIFTFVLINVVYIGIMKIKAQNAADNLALSAATLKARVLNSFTNLNGLLYISTLQFGYADKNNPYLNKALFDIGVLGAATASTGLYYFIDKYNRQINDERLIDRIAEANGLDLSVHRYALYPVHINIALDIDFNLQQFRYWQSPPIPPILIPSPSAPGITLPTAFEPSRPWYVQSRVEFPTNKAIIGGKRLGIQLPDIVTRARAEIIDMPTIPGSSWGHKWHVRLAQPQEDVDQYIRRYIGGR